MSGLRWHRTLGLFLALLSALACALATLLAQQL